MQSLKNFLVTGATGAIGSALIPVLLKDAGTRVRLLLRAKSAVDLTERLETLFRFWNVGLENQAFRQRVVVLRGDVTEPRLGLSDVAYSELCADCTHIIHAAGIVRMNLPIVDARRSAVGSARNIVQLARACPRLQKVEFVSTVGVGGRLSIVPETWLTESRAFHNTYEQAKAEAEEYIRGEVEHGLPLTVHRPSMVVGDSQTGRVIHFQIFYHLCEFLSGRRTLGLFPRLGTAQLDTLPVDFAARAIAWSSSRADLAGRVLHLCAGPEQATGLTDLQKRVRERFAAHGLKVPPCISLPPQVFTGLLSVMTRFMHAETRRAAATLPVFLDYLDSNQRFENVETRRLLESVGIALPNWTSYVDTVMSAYLSDRYPRQC